MSIKKTLKRALSAIDEAMTKLKRAKSYSTSDDKNIGDIQKAIRELEDAEYQIKKAIRDLPDD